jgi:ArsR family metal-binding transcriptional regulator
MKTLIAFPQKSEFEKMKSGLNAHNLRYEIINSEPGYSLVGSPALAIEQEVWAAFSQDGFDNYVYSGWVEYQPSKIEVPVNHPPQFETDLFGKTSIMIVAPCIADTTKIRLIAHISGDLTEVFPYLNTEMKEGCYNSNGPIFTFMEQYRMITLYPRKIAIAKADEIVDGWRTLEKIRLKVNNIFLRRASIEPSYEMRQKPPALEIYKRLPGLSCGKCGQKTCMAFALTLWSGNTVPSLCKPIFEGEFSHLKDAFLEICAGLGIANDDLPKS